MDKRSSTESGADGTARQPIVRQAVASSFFSRMTQKEWWRVADCGVFALWIAVVGFTLHYHEKWADEAQAWLIARDLNLPSIWFNELRYEGSPGLWHTILWVAQHVFHLGYGSIGFIGMAGATAGVALLLFKAPFPRLIRWPLAFSYVMVYQYAVIARPYTLLPLLAFAVALQFRDIKHPERMTLVLVLLATLCLHGTILAACFGLAYLVQAIKSWRTLESGVRNRYVICVALMAFVFLLLFVILKPTPDVEEFVIKRHWWQTTPDAAQKMQSFVIQKLAMVTSGAFLDSALLSSVFLVLAGTWCWVRRGFLTFALPVISMLALYSLVHGQSQHHGTVFIAAIAAIWIAWPLAEEQRTFSAQERWATHGMAALLLCLCLVNVWDSAVVIQHERLYAYSGAEDAAKYLKSAGVEQRNVFGFSLGVSGVQAYFDHNIFANMPTTYFHHGAPFYGDHLDLSELNRVNPEYVVLYSTNVEETARSVSALGTQGYDLVHFSDGYRLYKRIVYCREAYFILRRSI